MNQIVHWTAYWNRKIKKFTIVDVKLAQGLAIACVLIIVKLFPQVMQLSVWWFVVLAVICWSRIVYTVWIKADERGEQET